MSFMNKITIYVLLFISSSGMINAELATNTPPFIPDRPLRLLELPELPGLNYKYNLPDYKERRIPAMEEYMSRPQFEYLMQNKDKKEYNKKLNILLQDATFLNKFDIERNASGWLSRDMKEYATFNMGQYYFKHWTDFKVGIPELKSGYSFLDTLYDIVIRYNPIIPKGFDSPYRTVYDAEQSYKYYLFKYPNGAYTVPALFSIAQCRIHQRDYLEATVAYKYAFRFLMEQYGYTNTIITDMYAKRLIQYSRKYKDSLRINLQISKIDSTNYIDSRFEFDEDNTSVYIGITFGTFFGSSNMNLIEE